MTRFFEYFDGLAGIGDESKFARLLDRVAFVFLVLTFISAPHSIAATQIAWGCGMLAMVVRCFLKPRPAPIYRPLHIALWAFFGWSVISALMSYEPAISLDRLRGPGLFLICIFVLGVVRTRRTAYFLAFAMIVSSMINVVMTPIQRVVGRGVEIHGLKSDSPLAKAALADGDTILRVGKVRINSSAELVAAIESAGTVRVSFHRSDWYSTAEISSSDLLTGATADARLGIERSGPSHYWRMMGFYNHYTTYAEVLQLLMSLVFGLLLAALRKRGKQADQDVRPTGTAAAFSRIFTSTPFLVIAFAGMSLAMFMTVTRASQLSFVISAFIIIAVGASRKHLIAAAAIAIPVVVIGLFALQQSRQVGFFDSKDESTQYRLTMWRDGARIWSESPRHAVFGVGMDSVQTHWREWGMYKNGFLAMGHFHSTPVQLLVERGFPALLLWIAILAVYARSLWRGIRRNTTGDWRTIGILTGCLGGMVGFVSSGVVHWNLGDAEVAMVFFLLMGLGVQVAELSARDLRIET